MTESAEVIVVGGGAAGIFAALRASEIGAKVTLLEKTVRLGTKILVSGGGKCNVAHAGPLEDVIRAFRPNEARFIRPACYRFTNQNIVQFFVDRGLRVMTREDGRVFPVDQSAKDVVAILQSALVEAGVEIRFQSAVSSLESSEGCIAAVNVQTFAANRKNSGGEFQPSFGAKALLAEVLRSSQQSDIPESGDPYQILCKHVVLATGGSSYPNSGTTGDGWPWMRTLGHQVVKIRSALAPIYLKQPLAHRSGVALRGVRLRARSGGREFAKWQGDLLLTHHGISGPCALGISRAVAEHLETGTVNLEVDLCPTLGQEELNQVLVEYQATRAQTLVRTSIETWTPQSLIEDILAATEIPVDLRWAQLKKPCRNRLANQLKSWELGEVKSVPLEKGEVVAGGVSLEDVDPKTLRSRRMSGIYVCGEVLDVAGPVGGYNLQAAFATGYLAGETAALAAIKDRSHSIT